MLFVFFRSAIRLMDEQNFIQVVFLIPCLAYRRKICKRFRVNLYTAAIQPWRCPNGGATSQPVEICRDLMMTKQRMQTMTTYLWQYKYSYGGRRGNISTVKTISELFNIEIFFIYVDTRCIYLILIKMLTFISILLQKVQFSYSFTFRFIALWQSELCFVN